MQSRDSDAYDDVDLTNRNTERDERSYALINASSCGLLIIAGKARKHVVSREEQATGHLKQPLAVLISISMGVRLVD